MEEIQQMTPEIFRAILLNLGFIRQDKLYPDQFTFESWYHPAIDFNVCIDSPLKPDASRLLIRSKDVEQAAGQLMTAVYECAVAREETAYTVTTGLRW